MLILNVVGARPNFMKMAPVVSELRRRAIPQLLVHTGQHYDAAMSRVFFEELGMPQPDVSLGIGSGTHAQQTARVMVAIEEVCLERKPDMLVVGGDVNSTVAAALAASKLNIPVAHLEAGLRSFDRTMPEELNRIVCDHLSALLLTTESSGGRNLVREGIAPERIAFVGNCMVDSVFHHLPEALRRRPWIGYGVEEQSYAVLTLHRPSNVDDEPRLRELAAFAARIAQRMPVLFPVHPRTRARMLHLSLELPPAVHLLDPLPYIAFLGIMARAAVVLTDSGGMQEETTALRVPCLTLRSNTERPSTVELGSNELVGDDLDLAGEYLDRILRHQWKQTSVPPLWDGHAAGRVVDAIESFHAARQPSFNLAAVER